MERLMVHRSKYSAVKLRERCLARFGEPAVTAQIAQVYASALSCQQLAGSEQAA
jgi:hypothetical protein